MGLLDYRNPSIPAGDAYLEYYKNYRGPQYQYMQMEQPSPIATTGGYTGKSEESQNKSKGNDSGGYGEGQNKGDQGYSSPSRATNAIANLAVGSLVPGYGLASTLLGENPIDALGKNVDMGASYMGMQTPLGAMQSKAAMNALNDETMSLAQAFANSNAFNDAYGGNFADAISASGPLGDAPMAGSWGGDGGGLGSPSGTNDGTANGAGGGDFGSGWKNGGMIRPKKGLLDHEDDSMMGMEPSYGLLDGPKTKQRDNIPAVNVKTGEKIAVETGEMVMPRDVVKKKKKVLTKMIKTHHKEVK